tara:strand:+ start:77 stop:595 length:519 start_codon:yes stop_codon:yes gene_type:complete
MPQSKIISTTGSEIVSVSDAKSFIRIDTSDDDTLLLNMIKQARIWCENYIGKDIVAKSRQYYKEIANGRFEIPFAPIASITSVTVENEAVTYETYGLYDDIIEINTLGNHKDIIVSYTTSGQDDPLLQQAILQFVSTLYDNRADFVVMQGVSFVEIPANVEHILAPLKNAFI